MTALILKKLSGLSAQSGEWILKRLRHSTSSSIIVHFTCPTHKVLMYTMLVMLVSTLDTARALDSQRPNISSVGVRKWYQVFQRSRRFSVKMRTLLNQNCGCKCVNKKNTVEIWQWLITKILQIILNIVTLTRKIVQM